MRLREFNVEKEKSRIGRNNRTTYLLAIVLVFLILLSIIIHQSFALYKVKETHNLINTTADFFKEKGLKIAVFIDGIKGNDFPVPTDGKAFENISCTNSGSGFWDKVNWKLTITDITGATECNIYFQTAPKVNLKDAILADNGGELSISAKGSPNFTNISTTNDGMYATQNTTEHDEDGVSYYYRGAVPNNNLIFAGFQWKIIRITGEGKVKMIYNGLCPNNECNINTTVPETQIGNFEYNTPGNAHAYVGFMYGTPGSPKWLDEHFNTNNSQAKDKLEEWYLNNIVSLGTSITQKIADEIYCNDRRVGLTGIPASGTINAYWDWEAYYNAYSRLIAANAPTLKCAYTHDQFTLIGSTKGNKMLTYPIGLITFDEVVLAGGGYNKKNELFYLYNGLDYHTMTPLSYDGYSFAHIAVVMADGKIGYYNGVNQKYGIRPVITLTNETVISRGDGTINNPYIIE